MPTVAQSKVFSTTDQDPELSQQKGRPMGALFVPCSAGELNECSAPLGERR